MRLACNQVSLFYFRVMLILLSPAKTIRAKGKYPKTMNQLAASFTEPKFLHEAESLSEILAKFDEQSLSKGLKVSDAIARQTRLRYEQLLHGESEQNPAVFAYNGIVFKNLAVDNMSEQTLVYTNEHLVFTSFLYGLLRPFDVISPYRLEGDFRLGASGSVFDFWRDKLTQTLIDRATSAGGVLCNLASGEMKQLFDWKRVERELTVISPEFKTGAKTIVVHTKIARGLMSRFILENKMTSPEQLETFALGGYHFEGGVYRRD